MNDMKAKNLVIEIEDYPVFKNSNLRLARYLEKISEIAKALGNIFKLSVLFGPLGGLAALLTYLYSEEAIGVLLDTISSINFLLAIAVISFATLSIAILVLCLPIYSKFALFSIERYSPKDNFITYAVHNIGLAVILIAYPVAIGLNADKRWLFAIPAGLVLSTVCTLYYAHKKYGCSLNVENVFQISLSVLVSNILGTLWILGGFVLVLTPLSSLADHLLTKFPSDLQQELDLLVAYGVFLAGLLAFLAVYTFLSFVPLKTRTIGILAFLLFYCLMVGFPSAPFFTQLGLQALRAGGNIPVTLISTDHPERKRFGCLILKTPGHFALREIPERESCISDNRYLLFVRISRAPDLKEIRIIPADKYEIQYR